MAFLSTLSNALVLYKSCYFAYDKGIFIAFAAACFVAQKLHTRLLETQVLVNKQLFSCVVIEWE